MEQIIATLLRDFDHIFFTCAPQSSATLEQMTSGVAQ
jgi:hypothetical protein